MIERLEAAVGRSIESWTARLFGSRLQPVQIAKRLIRSMEAHRRIALERTFAPNSYLVALAPSDFATFEPYRQSLERDLAESILGAARDRAYTLVAFPVVEIAGDSALRAGEIRVSCALVDASGAAFADVDLTAATSHTVVLDRDALLGGLAQAPPARLEIPGAPAAALGAGLCVIGRDRRCDVLLDDPRVSRRHAEVRLRLGRYTIADLGSANGTRVNGRVVTESALADGDQIAIGPSVLTFRAERR